ncbi:hypothetical protein [Pseudomonas shirazensis]|uniref:hypothetical protein n=1 Tax=Pseudomonas shirazensis TaxID=2745494 RepID=UPI003D29276C
MATMAQYKVRLLNEFEARTDDWSFGQFEHRLTEVKVDTYYQDAKGIIIDAHKAGKWPKTVKRYLLTNYKAFGNVSSEFNDTFDQVLAGMTPDEKALWGLN